MLAIAGAAAPFPAGVAAGGVFYHGVSKSVHYQQATNGAPVMLATNPCVFRAFVYPTSVGSVTAATFKVYATTNVDTLVAATGGIYRFERSFGTQAAMDTRYPQASAFYSHDFTIRTASNGSSLFGLAFSMQTVVPVATVQVHAAQSINPGNAFTLRWSPASDYADDFVQVVVMDGAGQAVYSTTDPCVTNGATLTGMTTSAVIAAGTLQTGRVYTGLVRMWRRGQLTLKGTGPGQAWMMRETAFPLTTAGSSSTPGLTPPLLSGMSQSNRNVRILLQGESNRTYRVEYRDDGGGWNTLVTTNLATGQGTVMDTNAAPARLRIYRAVSP